MPNGSLVVVGTGISFPDQMTLGARDAIVQSDVTLFNVGGHALAVAWIKEHARRSIDLYECYREGEGRHHAYERMVDAICEQVRGGCQTCAAFYGHPGVFVGPGYEAMERLSGEGYLTYMLPGVSSVDCMFSDLEFDPARSGCAMYEATDFLARQVPFDPRVPLILWQVGVVGEERFTGQPRQGPLRILKEKLLERYPEDAQVINYAAATLPGMKAQVRVGTLAQIESLGITQQSTLLIPPCEKDAVDHKHVAKLREMLQPAAG